jgi:hypothetical protein
MMHIYTLTQHGDSETLEIHESESEPEIPETLENESKRGNQTRRTRWMELLNNRWRIGFWVGVRLEGSGLISNINRGVGVRVGGS